MPEIPRARDTGSDSEAEMVSVPAASLVSSEVIEEVFNPVYDEVQRTRINVEKLVRGVGEFNSRLEAIERAVGVDLGSDGDDEADRAIRAGASRPRKRTRSTRKSKTTGPPKPEQDVLHLIQGVVRRVLLEGCDASKMEELQLGLTDEELEVRVRDDPALPWRPDFLSSVGDRRNTFWVGKILDETLKDSTGQAMATGGRIPQQFWTREVIQEHVLKPMWDSARKGVRRATDPELHHNRLSLACGDAKHPPFQYVIGEESKTIPAELLTEDIMSDVLSEDDYDIEGIRPDVTPEAYRKARKPFRYEGVAPCYRHKMWTGIFIAMDDQMKERGSQQQPRFYASTENRGQRWPTVDRGRASNIPVGQLYRCHLDKAWYDRLPEWKRKAVKPSPVGWEVDEEIEALLPMEQDW